MIDLSQLSQPLGGMSQDTHDALQAAHDALTSNAFAADGLLSDVKIGPDGEGQDFADELEAIRDEARAAAAKIMALLSPNEAA